MTTITVLNENKQKIAFVGELLDEGRDEHQVERHHPINTETLKLYMDENGQLVFSMKFQFAGMYPHHYEMHVGKNLQEILKQIAYPTEATKKLLR